MGKRSREVDSASEDISDECRSEANCSEDYTPSSSESDGESGSASKRLKKLEAENAALKKKLSQSSADKGGKKKMQRGAPVEEEQQSSPAAVQAIVDKMRKSIAKQIEVSAEISSIPAGMQLLARIRDQEPQGNPSHRPCVFRVSFHAGSHGVQEKHAPRCALSKFLTASDSCVF